jgi:hypothetical protein
MARKALSRLPSPLGQSIQEAIEAHGRHEIHRPPNQYDCTYRVRGTSAVFLIERVTRDAITLWLPRSEPLERALSAEGLIAEVSLPYPYPDDPGRYGRLSGLKTVPELAMEPLLRVKVTSPGQALRILEALG